MSGLNFRALIVPLHRSLVGDARAEAPNRLDPHFQEWLAGYSEGVEHALETICAGGRNADELLAALIADHNEGEQ